MLVFAAIAWQLDHAHEKNNTGQNHSQKTLGFVKSTRKTHNCFAIVIMVPCASRKSTTVIGRVANVMVTIHQSKSTFVPFAAWLLSVTRHAAVKEPIKFRSVSHIYTLQKKAKMISLALADSGVLGKL
jgi:hypothetical protein